MLVPAPPFADTPTSAIERGLSSDATASVAEDDCTSPSAVDLSERAAASIHDPEARQREALGRMVLVDHHDLLPYVVDILRSLGADQRRRHQRAFVELDQRVDVADLVGETRMEHHVVAVERED